MICRFCGAPLRPANMLPDFCDPLQSMSEEAHCAHRWAVERSDSALLDVGFPWVEMARYRPTDAELRAMALRARGEAAAGAARCWRLAASGRARVL